MASYDYTAIDSRLYKYNGIDPNNPLDPDNLPESTKKIHAANPKEFFDTYVDTRDRAFFRKARQLPSAPPTLKITFLIY